jgi:uncharacterized OB-fold protein
MTDAAPPRSASPADEFLFIDAAWSLRQSYRADPLLAPFLAALKEKRLLGVRAGARVLFPPSAFDETTFAELHELVPVGPGGGIRTVTRIVPGGSKAPPPYLVVFVQLDGAACASPSRLRGPGSDVANPLDVIGRRCRAVFKPEPTGDWSDFWYEMEG